MVCEKCEKKLAKGSLATPEVRGLAGSSSAGSSSSGAAGPSRKIGENKLLTSRNRYTPYGGAAGKGVGGSAGVVGKCKTCKSTVARQGASYCQACAFKKGICAMCGKMVQDVTYSKQSSK